MKTSIYLAVTKPKKSWGNPTIKTTLKKPTGLKDNQVCVKVDLEIPDVFFERPTFNAAVTVDKAGTPKIDVTMAKDLAQVLSDQLGVRVHVSAQPADPEAADKLEAFDNV